MINEGVPPPMKASVDFAKTPFNQSLGQNEMSDFLRYSKRDVSNKGRISKKVHIMPLSTREKSSPKFYASQ